MFCSRNLLLRDLSFHQILKKCLSFFFGRDWKRNAPRREIWRQKTTRPKFQEKNKYRTVLEVLLIWWHSRANCYKMAIKILQRQNRPPWDVLTWDFINRQESVTIEKIRVEWMIFFPYYIWAENNNHVPSGQDLPTTPNTPENFSETEI